LCRCPSYWNRNTETHRSIVTHYNYLLRTDPLITQPIAAIESLISVLSASPPSTTSETLSLLASYTATLKASVLNPIPISAGTDLFQRYILSTLQTQETPDFIGKRKRISASGGVQDSKAIRSHLLANSRLFVRRAKEARSRIAEVARRFVREGSTVITCGRSRVVAAVLNAAADAGIRFRAIYVEESHGPNHSSNSADVVKTLRRRDIPVATIPFAALATALPSVTFALVGAESIVENGGAISGMGTHQIGLLMRSVGKPLYVAAESHKFVRVYPLNGEDLPIGQGALEYRTEKDDDESDGKIEHEEGRRKGGNEGVDFTPPELITAIVTEAGVQTPGAVSEELIKIWY